MPRAKGNEKRNVKYSEDSIKKFLERIYEIVIRIDLLNPKESLTPLRVLIDNKKHLKAVLSLKTSITNKNKLDKMQNNPALGKVIELRRIEFPLTEETLLHKLNFTKEDIKSILIDLPRPDMGMKHHKKCELNAESPNMSNANGGPWFTLDGNNSEEHGHSNPPLHPPQMHAEFIPIMSLGEPHQYC